MLDEIKYRARKQDSSMKLLRFMVTGLVLIFSLYACSERNDSDVEDAGQKASAGVQDLGEIKKAGKLRALTTYSATSYFLYRGEPMGFEYELLKRFADHLGLELEIVISRDIDSLFYELEEGNVDLIAHGLSVTTDRRSKAAFTDYLYLTHQVLVQRKPDGWRQMPWHKLEALLIQDPIQLIGDTVSVRKNSAYHHRLLNLSAEIGGGIVIDTLSGKLSTEEIIQKVADGKIKYTIADNNIASINAAYQPILHADVQVSFSQKTAWAVHLEADELLDEVNTWIQSLKKDPDYTIIYNNYFKNSRNFRERLDSDFYSLSMNTISPYDELIQQNAKRIGWDWRLMASLIYQESRFEPEASAWSSASGLMQLMPATAEELGVIDPTNPAENLRGGADYLKSLWVQFEAVTDSTERIKFALGAYNCGVGHVFDAQRLAQKYGHDHLTWENNVDQMILNLSNPQHYNDPVVYYGYVRGLETFEFVKQIFERFGHYKAFVE
jgi:membrane-bound lytic murein transglycosylase F